jgi:hypothetical protein
VASVVAASVHPGGSAAVMFAVTEHLASASGTAAIASEIGGAAFIGIYVRFICGGLKNWLGCEKRGLTLLPEYYPENDTFLLPSFSISFILF